MLPLRDQVVFPHTVVPLHIGRDKSIGALAPGAVMGGRNPILLVAQRHASDADPAPDRIYRVGVLAHIRHGLRLDDGSIKALFECTARGRIERFTEKPEYLEADVVPFVETAGPRDAVARLARATVLEFTNYVKRHPKISAETATSVGQVVDPSQLADIIASHLAIDIADKQEILESASVLDRLQRVLSSMSGAPAPVQAVASQSEADVPGSDAPRVGIPLPTLKFARYTGQYEWTSHEVSDPTWNQIETALRRLDQFEYPYVWLLLGSGADWSLMEKEGYLNILGGNGIFCVDGATPLDGRRRLSLAHHSRETRLDVWLSDQGFSSEERFVCKDIETIIRLARHFSIHRRLDPRLEWTPAAAVGVWEIF